MSNLTQESHPEDIYMVLAHVSGKMAQQCPPEIFRNLLPLGLVCPRWTKVGTHTTYPYAKSRGCWPFDDFATAAPQILMCHYEPGS